MIIKNAHCELFISVQRKEVKSYSQPTFTVKVKLWNKLVQKASILRLGFQVTLQQKTHRPIDNVS